VGGVPTVTYRVTFRQPLVGRSLSTTDLLAQTLDFEVTIDDGAGNSYPFDHLSLDAGNPYYFAIRINGHNPLLVFSTPTPPTPTAAPDNRPQTAAAAGPTLAGADPTANLTVGDYQNALDTLVPLKDVNMLAAPGTDPGVQAALRDQCESLLNRFAILDSQPGSTLSDVEAYKAGLESDKGYAAIYYPWIGVAPPPPAPGPRPPGPIPPVLVPPSGHVAGIYSRTDSLRGVHKAPAGEEAAIRGALSVERVLSDVDQGILNVGFGINAIRVFKPHGRPIVWGARTTATNVDSNWQYVNIRRLFLFLEGSISEGIRWAIFEPNNQELWKKLERTLVAFLTKAWRDGALFGATPKEAFYVRIDEALNPFTERQLGRLTVEIGVSPSYPAEFIVVRIGIWAGGSQVIEQ
jgi:phage tail sheath protein FI